MFFRQYHGEWYGVWCDHCGTDKCVCGHSASATDGSARPSYSAPLRIWELNDTRTLDQLARDFYRAVTRRMAYGENTTDEINTIAEVIAKGAAISCLGEARYELTCALHEVALRAKPKYLNDHLYRRSPLGKLAYERGWIGRTLDYAPMNRDSFGSEIAHHLTPAQTARLARHVFAMHLRFTGKSEGVGGVLWWEGAKLTDDYYRGRISPMVYADLMFNAMHNGGSLLNKAFSIDHTRLAAILDIKRWAEPEELLEFLSSYTAMYERVKAQLVDQHTISKQDLLALEKSNLIDYYSTGKKTEIYAVGFPAWYTVAYGLDDCKATTWSRAYTAPKQWNIARVPRSVLYATRTRRFKGESDAQYTRRMRGLVGSTTRDTEIAHLLAANAGMGAAFYAPQFPPPWMQNTGEGQTLNIKADKYEAFFSRYSARPLGYINHTCGFCTGYGRKHGIFSPEEYVEKLRTHGDDFEDEDEHYCSVDTYNCYHDGCCCCCSNHEGDYHNEWCSHYTNCDEEVEGCQCQDEDCCHQSYNSGGNQHSEGCYNYEEEEDDAEG